MFSIIFLKFIIYSNERILKLIEIELKKFDLFNKAKFLKNEKKLIKIKFLIVFQINFKYC